MSKGDQVMLYGATQPEKKKLKFYVRATGTNQLGTGAGCMLPEDCAKQVNAAINYVLVEKRIYSNPKGLYEEQDYMRKNIVSKKWLEVQMMGD